MRYLAIDYGLKRIGLAICDPSEIIASPLTVIKNSDKLIDEIAKIIDSESVEALVIGLPLNMDGSVGPQAEITQKFAQQLEKAVDIPIHFQDERLSTFAAEQKLNAADIKKTRAPIDAIAAAQILEDFLQQET